MRKQPMRPLYRILGSLLMFSGLLATHTACARVGGAGGHGYGGGGGHGFGGGGSSYGYGYGGGGGSLSTIIFIIVVVIVIYMRYMKQNAGNNAAEEEIPPSRVPAPEGLDDRKVETAFLAIQDAWQRKDLANVRKWLSDGMYQRLTIQFKMMRMLEQSNTLRNIRIHQMAASNAHVDGSYKTAEIAISFSMDDSFTSTRYPQFNEQFPSDADVEYWTFIKRSNGENDKNLYDNNNCPNCGAPFEVKMGEISRCSNCNTLTNSAAYDWVLSEITQAGDYSGGAGLSDDATLRDLMKNDPLFAVQRMEDIASNIFMQVMDALTGKDANRLTRFADEQVTNMITKQKDSARPFVFDRLYINNATLSSYTVDGKMVKLYFGLNATYRRADITGGLHMLDQDFVTQRCLIELSRSVDAPHKSTAGEIVYSYECSNCGAPFTDTTNDRCTYCDAPVVDKERNWVLTGFTWG
jgi:DNA-directed RNA polymerase subunit RPC12/RpoP/predicted lipid-binding transport protein (Tim44 family)